MLELNKWFFAQLANFLLLLLLLNIILFKPLMRLFKERDEATSGALNAAKSMDSEKNRILAGIEAKLVQGRTKARAAFEEMSGQGVEQQKLALAAAQNEAAELNKKAKQELEGAMEKARQSLRSDVEKFSMQIVEKLVKA